MTEKKPCPSVFQDKDGKFPCQLPDGHRGKHRNCGTPDEPCSVYWTDAGLAALLKEKASAGSSVMGQKCVGNDGED